jgi:hypothetical protein
MRRASGAASGLFFAERGPRLKRWGDVLAWVFFGLAALSLAAWPLMIWWRVNNGLPVGPATLETLPYPLGALFFGIIARGLKLWTDLPPLTQRNRLKSEEAGAPVLVGGNLGAPGGDRAEGPKTPAATKLAGAYSRVSIKFVS